MAARLEGQAALIAGASSGVGLATAQRFVEEGARVTLTARRADALRAIAEDLGSRAVALPCDVTDCEMAEAMVARAIEAMGGLDIVVNAAGIAEPCRLEDLSGDTFDRTLAVNLSGSYYVSRAAALFMRENGGGAIVNLGSELSHVGAPNLAHYCASKAAILGLTRAMALELAPSVRVNAVCPGAIDTPMLAGEFDWCEDPARARLEAEQRVPLKRFLQADEVAKAILFLAVDAPYATGSALCLDGGTVAM